MTVAHICPHEVSIKRQTATYNEIGARTKSYSTVLTGVKVRIAVKAGELVIEDSGALEEHSHQMMSDVLLVNGDVVVFGALQLQIMRVYPVPGFGALDHYSYFLKNTQLANT